MKTILKNGRVITPIRVIKNGGIVIEDGKIVKVFEGDGPEVVGETKVIDVEKRYISPGFVDIHTHGAGGHDYMDGTVEAIEGASKAHMKHGTTTVVPTTLTSTMEELFAFFDCYRETKRKMEGGPNMLGLHLEGPYFSMEQKGAQDPRYIKSPERDEYLRILDHSDDIVRWTVAPELDGAMKMGRELTDRGILCSIGHSNAIYQDVLEAFENGYTHITHLYSGMSMVRRIDAYRYSGVVESAYLIDEMTVEIIADGDHLPESLLKLIYKIKGSDRICLVTDSMRAAGMPEGKSILGSLKDGQEVIVEDGVAKLLDRSAFAGSVATADRLVRTMTQIAAVPIEEAVKMITLTPARIMGIEGTKGSLVESKDADIVVFDDNIEIDLVIVGGNVEINNI
ncbi:MAG: N-acetylglucosamine-6-phosphate deacetylase [Clostridiales bacterium]|nr:N-acetylglucosamine-6-phosphate deacetylase [Clostridiales bacterium]